MEIPPEIKLINRQLQDNFGVYSDGRPKFRVVWNHDQFEKRRTDVTPEGWKMMYPTVIEMPKYRQYMEPMWILEKLMDFPDEMKGDLVENTSYECIWAFMDNKGNPLPPRFDACKLIIDTMMKNMSDAHSGKVRYSKDPEKDLKELNETAEALFGNETPVTDALAHDFGVTVPGTETLREKKEKEGLVH